MAEIKDIIKEVVEDFGLELYHLESRPGLLRVFVDNKDRLTPVSIETCASVSRRISERLDLENFPTLVRRYFLEVSSPGIERPLHLPEHFARYVGRTVLLRIKGETLNGKILAVGDNGVKISVNSEKGKESLERIILFSEIKSARLLVSNEELFAKDYFLCQSRY